MRPEPESGSGTLSRPVVARARHARSHPRSVPFFVVWKCKSHSRLGDCLSLPKQWPAGAKPSLPDRRAYEMLAEKKGFDHISSSAFEATVAFVCASGFLSSPMSTPAKEKKLLLSFTVSKKKKEVVVQDSPALQGAWA